MRITVNVELVAGDTMNPSITPDWAALQVLTIFGGDQSKDSCTVTMNSVPPPPGYVGPPLEPGDPIAPYFPDAVSPSTGPPLE